MGLFDDLSKKAGDLASGAGGGKAKLLVSALQVIMGRFGGLGGLVQAFESKGLGGIAQSWMGKGANQPITPQQLRQGLGDEAVRDIAGRTGQPEGDVLSGLAGELPNLVDKLTPDGKEPEGNLLEKGLSLLGQKKKA